MPLSESRGTTGRGTNRSLLRLDVIPHRYHRLMDPAFYEMRCKTQGPGGKRDTSRLGNVARGALIAAFLQMGKCVLVPLNDDQRYDLVIDDGGRLIRIQCKSARLINGAIVFHTSSYNTSTGHRNYRGDADFFGVYCPALQTCYLVPVDDAPDRECRLRVNPSRNKQSRRIRLAQDYLIPNTMPAGP